MQIWQRTGTTIVFITHDIEEAVFLGQRVAVMSARPGRIKALVDIRLDRSGAPGRGPPVHAAFAAYRHEIWALLRQANLRVTPEEVHDVA